MDSWSVEGVDVGRWTHDMEEKLHSEMRRWMQSRFMGKLDDA